jgi:hypothetical protein
MLLRLSTSFSFASPKVGDQTFVGAFNQLGLTSWRVVNKQDIVPHLPPLFSYHRRAFEQQQIAEYPMVRTIVI